MDIPIALIVNGEFKNVVIPTGLLAELCERLRLDGHCEIHLSSGSIIAEGLLVLGKGSTNKFMVFDGGN